MKTLTPEGLSYPDVPLPFQSVILCVVHPITYVLCVPIRPGLQKIQLHLQHNPPLHSLVVATARIKRRGKNGRCGRKACQAHWPKAGSQPATSTGQLFPMKLKKFLTLLLCSLVVLLILPPLYGLWVKTKKNPCVFRAQKQNKEGLAPWLPRWWPAANSPSPRLFQSTW